MLEIALKLFEKSVLHPAVERQARIWDKLGDTKKAKSLAEKLLENSKFILKVGMLLSLDFITNF